MSNRADIVVEISVGPQQIEFGMANAGIPGMPGRSAYKIAVDNGFIGTEEEWLESLHGSDGKDGIDGNDGYTPIKGIDYFDGEQGPKGDTGEQGPKGEQGDKGDTGEPGPKGDKGNDGYTPIKGVDYFDGIDGIDGKDGDKGDKGDKGETGADGYTPIKGVDYWTAADQEAIVSDVLAADGSYELIETITLTENVASIVRTQEPDGTPYSFIGLKVLAIVSTGTGTGAGTATFRYKNSNILTIGSVGYIATDARYWFIWAKLENGAWNFERTSGNTGQWDTSLGANTTSELRLQNQYPLIDQLIINATTSGVPFPAGSIFRIYGVRA